MKKKKKRKRETAKQKTVNRRKWHCVFISLFMARSAACFTPAKTKPITVATERWLNVPIKTSLNKV